MKQIKYFLIVFIGMLLMTSASYGQSPRVYMKYNVEIYTTNKPMMYIQVWKPGQTNTITDAWSGYVVAHQAGESESNAYVCTGYNANWDIYSVQIMDNSGGNNNAYIGGSYPTTDDFDYKPNTIILNYDATFYPMGIHAAGVQLD